MSTSIFERCRKIIATTLVITIISSFTPVVFAASTLTFISSASQVGSLNAGVGGSATYLVTVNRTGSGNLDVVMSVTSFLPSGVTASFSPATVSFTGNTPTSDTTTLTLTTTAASPSGATVFTIQGAAGTTTTTTATLTIGSDVTPPIISETTPVPSPTSDNTPNYTFTTDEAGTITYGGSCSSATAAASSGSNTVIFNTLADGTYSNCTITVTDGASNVSNTLVVTTFTVDTTGPVISEVTPVSTPTSDNTPSYTFTSNTAGTITYGGSCSSATTSASVGANPISFNTLADGIYSNCTITVTDDASNPSNILAVSTFTVDTTAPVITLTGSTPVTVEVGSVYSDAGATASDNIDGDRTANITSVNPVNSNLVGAYTVTYDVFDATGNAATQVTRTVNVVDTTVPVIALVGSATVSVNFGDTYTDAGATASDNYDGDITGSIVTVNPVNTGAIGNYIVTYNVVDANGNAAVQVTRSVDVVDVTAPVITVTGANPMTVEVGGTYTELGAVASDDVDADFAATPSGSVNTSAVGTYTITYNATDTSGNIATAVTRTVNVVDTTLPVLTLLGITPTTVERTQVYTDSGATASDNLDGDITASIIIVNPVNTLVIGIYVVTYNVSDNAGNDAVEITRTVNVVDTTSPVISEVTPVTTPTSDNTPNYTFTTNEAGTITYGGSCSSATTAASSGSNTVTFNTLADGTYTNCTITVTDGASNVSNTLAVTTFTVDTTVPDTTAPVISQTTAVTTPTNDPTPSYTFTTDEAGTITYGGSCSSATTSATVGANPISFNTLADGTYSNCTITVTDGASNVSNVLNVNTFVVDTSTPPSGGGGVVDPTGGVGTPPTSTPEPTPTPTPEPTPTPTPTPEPEPTPDNTGNTPEMFFPPVEPLPLEEEPAPANTGGTTTGGTTTGGATTTGGTGGTTGGTTTTTTGGTFNPADATLDTGGGGTTPEEVTPTDEAFNPADATLDTGGGTTATENSYTLLWILLGIFPLLNGWWYFAAKNKKVPIHRNH